MDEDLLWEPAWKLAREIAARDLSPVELAENVLRRIDKVDPNLNSFLTVTHEVALEQARAAEDAVTRGDDLGALHGVPVSIKDSLLTKGIRTTCGSLHYEEYVPDEDSVVAERLRSAGAVLVGKTNTPELCAFGRTVNRLKPECVNPWDPTRIPGASSGGAAASVAAGLTAIALGTDGGGSVRLPSALCGIVGLLPTTGRVPRHGQIGGTPASRIGPMSRDVRDNALLLSVIAGPDPRDPRSIGMPTPSFTDTLGAGVEGLRMAWTPDFGHLPVHEPRVIDTAARAARELSDAGALVENLDEGLDDARWLIVVLEQTDEFVALLRSFFADPEKAAKLSGFFFDPSNTGTSPHGAGSKIDDLPRARAEAERITRNFVALFDRYDVVLSPTFGNVAPKIPPGWEWPVPMEEWIAYTYLTNMTGTPSISVPCGFVDGLPVGLQVMGRPGDEATILRVASALEQLHPWSGHRPPLARV